MYYAALIVGLALLALLALQVYRIAVGYSRATGTKWQRFMAAFSHSHTVFVARLGAIVSAGAAWIINFLPSLDPTSPIGAALGSVLEPKYVPYYALGFAVLIEVVRKWPSSIDPITPPPQAVTIPAPPPVATNA